MRIRSLSIAALMFGLGSTSAFAGNPTYDSWASHAPGTCVTMAGTTDAAGMKTESEMLYTLKSVTPEKVVVEVKTSMKMMGNKTEMPATSIDIPATAAATPATPPADQTQDAAETKTSEEKVTVAGKEYAATCTTVKSDANGMKTTSMVWTNAEVPGNTLKMESNSEGQMKVVTKMEVTKIEIK